MQWAPHVRPPSGMLVTQSPVSRLQAFGVALEYLDCLCWCVPWKRRGWCGRKLLQKGLQGSRSSTSRKDGESSDGVASHGYVTYETAVLHEKPTEKPRQLARSAERNLTPLSTRAQ
eukprot:scaffold3238_cov240-Pinguiococcus_pyrenoidosus.AAC.5